MAGTRGPRGTVGTVVAVLLALAGCSGGSEPIAVRTTAPGSPTTPAATSAPATTTSPGKPGGRPRITIAPDTGLKDGQRVAVRIEGFTPGQTLIAIECADKGKATTSGDCAISAASTFQSGSDGTGTTTLRVLRGPFGTNGIVCGRQVGCIVSVNQPVPTPTEQASAAIRFG